jgi:hypothetical protein
VYGLSSSRIFNFKVIFYQKIKIQWQLRKGKAPKKQLKAQALPRNKENLKRRRAGLKSQERVMKHGQRQ